MRLASGQTYHIYNRGINRGRIFFEDRNCDFFLRRFKKYVLQHVDLLAYCLMPNHFHLLVRINEFDAKEDAHLSVVEKAFKNFFISYAKAVNAAYGRTGALLQYKFKRKEVNDEEYFSWLVFYIHSNPIKSGLTKRLDQYQYTSYVEILQNDNSLVKPNDVLNWFGGLDAFEDFHRRNLESDRDGAEKFTLDF
jgi:REP element-mobilizing transposase RayT